MKLNYKFQNLLGAIYHKGKLEFSVDGNQLFSPVGNKIVVFDAKNNKSEALPLETEYNLANLAISPNGFVLLASTEKTHLYVISLVSGIILHRKEFKDIGERINDIQFSPDGHYYAVCGCNRVLVYITPGFITEGKGRELSCFKIHKIINSNYDEASCIAWSGDSKFLAIGGRDMNIRIFPIDRSLKNVGAFVNISGHSDIIISCHFANNTPNPLNLYSLSRNGHLFVWEANYSSCDELNAYIAEEDEEGKLFNYHKSAKHYFSEHLKVSSKMVRLTSSTYNAKSKLLVVGFSNGSFLLYEMPDFVLIHSLQLSTTGAIDSLSINNTGDWIAIGSSISSGTKYDIDSLESSQSQLIIWEWQSESFIFKQSGAGAGVTNVYECISYSPDATMLATGGTDGKIKLWNMLSGFCVATFAEEHRGPITAIEFVPGKNGKVLLSASLDGTVRAFDLNRYRNFRTLAAPYQSKPAQFTNLAIDRLSGDIVAAGAHNFFEIFLWSLQTGRLLECLSGHEGPVSGVSFSPISNTLVSCSWDKTVRIWDLFEGPKCTREVVKLGTDALAIAFRPDGHQFAVATLNGSISFFNPHTADQNGAPIEGQNDLGKSQNEIDKAIEKNKFFSTLDYSADGTYIVGGGRSKYICIYHVEEKLLAKKFLITWNQSMDGMFEFMNKRKISEFGFNQALIKHRHEENSNAPIALPGVTKSDFSSRSVKPIIAIYSIKFSPTMRTFAFASTEGIMVYSVDNTKTFDPYQLEINITPVSVKECLKSKEYSDALMQALKLNEKQLIQNVLEQIPVDDISFVSSNLPISYIEKCLKSIAVILESTKHIEFYLKWCKVILYQHGTSLKNSIPIETLMPTLRLLQQNLTRQFDDIGKVCQHNKYIFKFILKLNQGHHSNVQHEMIDEDSELENEMIE